MGRKAVKVGHRSPSKRHLKVGLTGSLASGKSTTLKDFKDLGWKVASADEIVASIYKKEGLTKADILKRFGRTKAGIKKLERWIHPIVGKEIKKFMSSTKKPVIVEVPLLFEAKFDKYFDLTMFVFAPLEDRIRRVKKRGMDMKLFKFLDGLQLSPEKKARRANLILENRSKHSLKKQVKLVSKILLR